MAYDIPSISDLEAIQLLNKHYAEVVTSKKDGIASGLDITQTTNPITGVVRRTLYKILDDMDDTFLERLLKMAFTPVGTFTAGATLTDARQTLLWEVSQGGDGHYYSWSGSFPKVVAPSSSPSPITSGSWVYRTDDSLRDEIRETVFQNMKRLAKEAGYNLVDGSFEEGAIISGWPDVVWCQTDGKYYQWHLDEAKTIAAGSTPATTGGIGAGAWVDRSDVTLRGGLIEGPITNRGVDLALRDFISVSDFGEIGNSIDGDDYVLQSAIDYMHKITNDTGTFGTLRFDGVMYIKTPKNLGKNIRLVGSGRNFRSVIKPMESFVGDYLIGIDGDLCIGGHAFRISNESFTIDCSLISTKAQIQNIYKIHKAYDISLRNIWIYAARGTGINIDLSNLIIIDSCSLYGVIAAPGESEYGIRVMSAGTGGGAGGVKIINPDIEVWNTGILQETNSNVQLINPYMERNITGWKGYGDTSGSFTIIGGECFSPGGSGTAALVYGDNITVVGGNYKSNGGNGLTISTNKRHTNTKIVGTSGDILDQRGYSYKEITETSRWFPSKARKQADVADSVSTAFYNITCPFLSSNFGVCDITLNARDNSGYSLFTAKYRFSFSNPDGTLRVSPLTEYAKSNVNISANYSLSVSVAAVASGTTITINITCDSGGALGSGKMTSVSTEAELIQWSQLGSVYITPA